MAETTNRLDAVLAQCDGLTRRMDACERQDAAARVDARARGDADPEDDDGFYTAHQTRGVTREEYKKELEERKRA
jgi:hypothetical protein